MDTTEQLLSQPFDPRVIKWRPGARTKDRRKALALAYVDARDVMARLDSAFGSNGWSDFYRVLPEEVRRLGDGRTVTVHPVECTISARGTRKADVGYPNGDEDEEPMKGAYSDAFKRAAVKWGVGRDLYDMPQFWLPIDESGRFTVVPSWNPATGRWEVNNEPGLSRQTSRVAQTAAQPDPAPAPELATDAMRKQIVDLAKQQGLTLEQLSTARAVVTGKGSSRELTVADVQALEAKLRDETFLKRIKAA